MEPVPRRAEITSAGTSSVQEARAVLATCSPAPSWRHDSPGMSPPSVQGAAVEEADPRASSGPLPTCVSRVQGGTVFVGTAKLPHRRPELSAALTKARTR